MKTRCPSFKSAQPRPGFSLLELLVVISILAALVGLLLPAAQAARESARRTDCANRLRQVGLALHQFHQTNQAFPMGSQGTRLFHPTDRRQISWIVGLLPFLELQSVRDEFQTAYAYDSMENRAAGSVSLPTFLCPSASTAQRPIGNAGDRNQNGRWDPGDDLAFTDYAGMFGAGLVDRYPFMNGVFIYDQAISEQQIHDGLGHTIAVVEDVGRPLAMQSEWANGQNILDQTGPLNVTRNNEIWSDHPGGAQVVMADAAVRWLSESMEINVLLALCTRDQEDRHLE